MLPNQVRDWTPRGPNIAFFIDLFAVFKGPEGRVREIQDAAQGVSGGVWRPQRGSRKRRGNAPGGGSCGPQISFFIITIRGFAPFVFPDGRRSVEGLKTKFREAPDEIPGNSG